MVPADIFNKMKDGSLQAQAAEILFFIPVQYFNSKTAVWLGEKVSTLGVIYIQAKMTDTSKPRLFQLTQPIPITIPFTERYKTKVALGKSEVQEYEVVKVKKGDIAISSTQHIQEVEAAKTFIDFFNQGKLPTDVPYDELPDLFRNAIQLNNMKLGVPAVLVDAMIGEMARDARDDTIPFRMTAGKNGGTTKYELMSIKNLAETSSVFAALSFENINKAVRTSVRKTRNGAVQQVSPVEKVLHN